MLLLVSLPALAGFVDVTDHAGVEGTYCGWSVAAGDYDADGLPDLYVTSHIHTPMKLDGVPVENRLYRNLGGLRFGDVTDDVGLRRDNEDPHHVSWVDYDGDSDLDLYVQNGTPKRARPERPNVDITRVYSMLWENEGGLFTERAVELGLAGVGYRTRGGAWADMDLDGDPDFYGCGVHASGGAVKIGEGSPLFRNDGVRFENVAAAAGVDRAAEESFLCNWGDVNSDGLPDLLVTPQLTVYQNMGDGTFYDVTRPLGLDPTVDSVAASWMDYDDDGDQDLLIGHSNRNRIVGPGKPATVHLYRNDRGHFVDVTEQVGIEELGRPRSIVWGDVNNDGVLDLFLPSADAWRPHRLYIGTGEGTFREAAAEYGVAGDGRSGPSDSTLVDLDGDGRLDLLWMHGEGVCPANAGPVRVFRNEIEDAGNYVAFDLRGADGRASMFGARVEVQLEGRTLHRTFDGAQHYLSQDSVPLHVGVGDARSVDVVVNWPDRTSERFEGLPVGRVLRVTQGSGALISPTGAVVQSTAKAGRR